MKLWVVMERKSARHKWHPFADGSFASVSEKAAEEYADRERYWADSDWPKYAVVLFVQEGVCRGD